MKSNQQLKYVKHDSLEVDKWNRCIDESANCRIYAYDWHLDRSAENWDALIWGNYEFVLPLPIRKKFGISYLYQPLFSQQLGIFPNPPAEIAELFYKELFRLFRYCDMQLNSANRKNDLGKKIDFLQRENYLLPLSVDYKELSKNYSKNTKRNIKKAENNSLQYFREVSLENYLLFKQNNLAAGISKTDVNSLKNLIAYGLYKGYGKIFGVYTKENDLCAAVYFCQWKNRVIYMNAASDEKGKELHAMFFLIDNFIREQAGKNLVLDFEGSMIPGVARFYKGFGATPETYFQLKFNRLPLPVRWLKQ
jgi:hypothetical protein